MARRNSGPWRGREPHRTSRPGDAFLRGKHHAQAHCTSCGAGARLAPLMFSAYAGARAGPVVEVVFVLDTTGSMAGLIEGAKRKIWSIATSIVDCSPDAEIRMGLVAYRDIGDEYVTKRFDLTTDIQDLYADLLRLRAAGGGDWPESVNEALYVAVTKMSWSARPRRHPHHLPGRRRAAAHGPPAGHEIPAGGQARPSQGYRDQCRAGRRGARHRAGVARDRADGPRRLHPDPAGRRQDRDHRVAL